MATILKVLVVLTMYSLIGVKCQPATPCTQPNYDRCVRDLTPLLHAAQTYYIKYTVDRMKELCSEYKNTKSCIQQFEQHCDPGVKNDLQSTHAYYEYICDNTFSVFERNRDCLVRPQLEARAQDCNNSLVQSLTSPGPSRPCGHFKAFIDCLSTEVKLICGQEAGDWQRGLDKATITPIISPLMCDLDLEDHAYCTNDNLQRCFAPLRAHPISDGSHIVPTHTAENIVEICKAYTHVRPCIDLFIFECYPQHQRDLRSLHDSYKYVCDDTLLEYFGHRDCLAKPTLHSKLTACHSTFDTELKKVDYSRGSVQSKYAKLCEHANTMVDCVQGLVQSFCGPEAAQWQRGLDIAVYKPLLDYFECELGASPSSSASTGGISATTISAIIVPAAVILLVLIAALILICVCIKRNRKQNHHQRMDEEEIGQNRHNAAPRVVYTVPPPVLPPDQGAMAALPPDLLPPEYSEKPQVGEMLLAAALAYQSAGDDVKLPLPDDDDAGYATVQDPSAGPATRGSVLQPPVYDDVQLGPRRT